MRRLVVMACVLGLLAGSVVVAAAQNFAFTGAVVASKVTIFTGSGNVRRLGRANFEVPNGEMNARVLAAIYAFGAVDSNGNFIRNAMRSCRVQLTGAARGSASCDAVDEQLDGQQLEGLVAIIPAAPLGNGKFGMRVTRRGGRNLSRDDIVVDVALFVDAGTLAQPGHQAALQQQAKRLLLQQVNQIRQRHPGGRLGQ